VLETPQLGRRFGFGEEWQRWEASSSWQQLEVAVVCAAEVVAATAEADGGVARVSRGQKQQTEEQRPEAVLGAQGTGT
jgi:hypothetical protein